MIYMIAGKGRSGKNTFGTYLKDELEKRGRKVCTIEIMRTLKGYCRDYFGWDGSDETKPRDLLQRFGTEIIREKMDMPLFHINRLMEDIKVLSYFFDDFIVPDVRFPLELEEVKKIYRAVSIHITREDIKLTSELSLEQQKHITETALDNFDDYDYKIINKTLDLLKKDAEHIVREVEENEENDK